jgi:hypothetical protein
MPITNEDKACGLVPSGLQFELTGPSQVMAPYGKKKLNKTVKVTGNKVRVKIKVHWRNRVRKNLRLNLF